MSDVKNYVDIFFGENTLSQRRYLKDE